MLLFLLRALAGQVQDVHQEYFVARKFGEYVRFVYDKNVALLFGVVGVLVACFQSEKRVRLEGERSIYLFKECIATVLWCARSNDRAVYQHGYVVAGRRLPCNYLAGFEVLEFQFYLVEYGGYVIFAHPLEVGLSQ